MIPYGKQSIDQKDIEAVIDVLKSDFITQGNQVPRFEDIVSSYVNSKFSVAVSSGTSALHIACLALGLKPSDTVWTVPNTFVASANCALYCGAKIDFVDIHNSSFNIDISDLESKLKKAKDQSSLPKILIPVHFSGQPTAQEDLWKLSKEYGFKIIEDATHSIGASRNGEKVGSCKWSDITIFSFHPVKIITTAEGGMALTNDTEIASNLRLYRSHGIVRENESLEIKDKGPWYYEQQFLGYNYRMTELSAALGIRQMEKIDKFVSKRNELAERYEGQLKNLPLVTPKLEKGNYSSWHLYVIRFDFNEVRLSYESLFKALREEGIGVNLHYLPVHLQPYYKKMGFKEGDFPNAELHACSSISIPIFPGMTVKQQDYVIKTLDKILK